MSDRDIGYAVAAQLIDVIALATYCQRISETPNLFSQHSFPVATDALPNTPNQLFEPASDKRLAADG